jgi:hypothetical protein
MNPNTSSLEGKLVAIKFWDHVLNSDEPLLCELYGRVAFDLQHAITIDCWIDASDGDEKRSLENNTECFTLVRSAIVEISELRRVNYGTESIHRGPDDQPTR